MAWIGEKRALIHVPPFLVAPPSGIPVVLGMIMTIGIWRGYPSVALRQLSQDWPTLPDYICAMWIPSQCFPCMHTPFGNLPGQAVSHFPVTLCLPVWMDRWMPVEPSLPLSFFSNTTKWCLSASSLDFLSEHTTLFTAISVGGKLV